MKTRRISPALIIAAATGLLGAGGIAYSVSSPFDALSRGRILLFVGDCDFSRRAFRNLAKAPKGLRDWIVPVVVGGADDVAREACTAGSGVLRTESLRYRLIPEHLLCRWLMRDAATFHRERLLVYPAYSIDGVAVPPFAERSVLRSLGVAIENDEHGGTLYSIARATVEPAARAPANSDEGAINQPVGW